MRHLKIYEKFNKLKIEDLKTYILIKKDNGVLDILKINNKLSNYYNNQPACQVSRIYTITNNGIKKITHKDPEKLDITLRLGFILEYMINHSDNIDDLLKIAELELNTSKYNI